MMNGTIAGFALSTVFLAACSAGGAPDSVDRMARSEVEAIVQEYLTENPEVLQAALVEVQQLERRQTFESLLGNPADPTVGPDDAPITIVEFFDYNCGFCRQANDWLFEQVDDGRGDVRVVFKEYPILAQSSLDATAAAIAAPANSTTLSVTLPRNILIPWAIFNSTGSRGCSTRTTPISTNGSPARRPCRRMSTMTSCR